MASAWNQNPRFADKCDRQLPGSCPLFVGSGVADQQSTAHCIKRARARDPSLFRPGAIKMARTMRARRRRGVSRRRPTKKNVRGRTGRKMTSKALWMAGQYARMWWNRRHLRGPFRHVVDRIDKRIKQAGTIGGIAAAGGLAAGRLRMDGVAGPSRTPTISRGIIARRTPATHPYGSRDQGRPYKRRRVSFGAQSNAGIVQLTRSYKRFKRAKNVMSAVKKLDKTDAISYGGIYQAINPLNGTSAARVLYNFNGDGFDILPIHVYRLDDQILNGAISQSSQRAIGYELRSNDTDNYAYFNPLAGDNMTTSARDNYGYQLLWARDSFSPTIDIDKTILRHVKIDIMMRGIRTRPTVFKVQIVQFKREAIAPEHAWTAGTTFEQERTRFWTQLAKPLVSHPLANNPRDFQAGEYMKVVKTYYKSFQPDLTTNADTTPLQHRMTIKLNLNRMCDYTRRFKAPGDNENLFLNEPETFIENVNQGQHGHVGSWKARMYMIISATVNSGPVVAGGDADCPQYDISIRPVHTIKENI